MTSLAITARAIFDGEKFHQNLALFTSSGTVVGIVPPERIPAGVPRHDLGSLLVVPGFIDAQVNGGGGTLLNDQPTVEGVAAIVAAHRRFGTAALLPTVITDDTEVLKNAVAAVREARSRGIAGVAGLHVEGPFIDEARRGAHPQQYVRPFQEADLDWLQPAGLGVLMLTLSPSAVSPADIRRLTERGIIVSLGHSDASDGEAAAALAAGAKGFTHLFNAMSQLGGRAPGMVGAALASPEAWCGLIADGHHVEPTAIRVALAAKRPGTLYLVSDAMPTAAGGPDTFKLQGREVVRSNGRLTLADGTLAGSDLTMSSALRYAVTVLGIDLAEALRMATVYPARALGLGGGAGRLVAGGSADWIALDSEFVVAAAGFAFD